MIAYIARDRDGDLYLYKTRPKKDLEHNVWITDDLDFLRLNNKKEFSKIKWEDKHPTKVEIKIKEITN